MIQSQAVLIAIGINWEGHRQSWGSKSATQKLIGMARLELALDQIEWSFSAVVDDGCPAFAPAHSALKRERAHQALDGAARDP